jgi:hypothetical protein
MGSRTAKLAGWPVWFTGMSRYRNVGIGTIAGIVTKKRKLQ